MKHVHPGGCGAGAVVIVEEAPLHYQLAHAKRVQLLVGHLLDYHPAVQYMKILIDRGEVGPGANIEALCGGTYDRPQ